MSESANSSAVSDLGSIAGTWTYRSFLNDPELVKGDAEKALALIFGEGTFALSQDSRGAVTGKFDMGGGYVLNITGQLEAAGTSGERLVNMVGKGVVGTPTAGWEYDYQAYPAPMWPSATAQVRTLVGTTLRAVPHNGQPAGATASIILIQAAAAGRLAVALAAAVAAPPLGYAVAILPKFRPQDINCMSRRGVNLAQSGWMCDPIASHGFADHGNARWVFGAISAGVMPPDGAWPQDWQDTYSAWMDGGFQP